MFAHILTKDFLEREYTELGKTRAQIAREIGVCHQTVFNYLRKHGIPTNETWRYKSHDLTGQKFGRLTVVRRSGKDKHHKCRWRCQCECGETKDINASSLLRGLTTSCGCYARELNRRGYEDISESFWRRLVDNAAQRGIEFDITPEILWKVYQEQGCRCAYTGLPVEFSPNSNHPSKQSASVDRIDSGGGYVVDNIQVVHKVVNLMKSHLGHKEFVAFCNTVAAMHKMDSEECSKYLTRTILRKGAA